MKQVRINNSLCDEHDITFTLILAPYLPRVADLLKMYDHKGYTVTVRQLDLNLNDNYRPVLRRIKQSDDNNIVLDCSIEALPEILKQAQQVGLLTDHHQILITNLDMHTIDLEPYQYSGTNITGIRLIDPEDLTVQMVTRYFADTQQSLSLDVPEGLTPEKMLVETALMYDAVLLFGHAYKQLQGRYPLQLLPMRCDDTTTWKNGYSIINYMKTVSDCILEKLQILICCPFSFAVHRAWVNQNDQIRSQRTSYRFSLRCHRIRTAWNPQNCSLEFYRRFKYNQREGTECHQPRRRYSTESHIHRLNCIGMFIFKFFSSRSPYGEFSITQSCL